VYQNSRQDARVWWDKSLVLEMAGECSVGNSGGPEDGIVHETPDVRILVRLSCVPEGHTDDARLRVYADPSDGLRHIRVTSKPHAMLKRENGH
jgi:hypothetical protein